MSTPLSGVNLQEFLLGSGMLDNPMTTAQTHLDYDTAVSEAIEEWEHAVSRHPFFADSADSTRYFDPPGPVQTGSSQVSLWTYVGGGWELDISPGLVSLTSVQMLVDGQVSTTYTVGGNGVTGQVYPWPENYAALHSPIERLRFVWPVYGLVQTLAVTGKWGYENPISSTVKTLLLKKAALSLLPSLARIRLNALGGGAMMVKQENVTQQFLSHSAKGHYFQAEADQWEQDVAKGIFRYKARAFA